LNRRSICLRGGSICLRGGSVRLLGGRSFLKAAVSSLLCPTVGLRRVDFVAHFALLGHTRASSLVLARGFSRTRAQAQLLGLEAVASLAVGFCSVAFVAVRLGLVTVARVLCALGLCALGLCALAVSLRSLAVVGSGKGKGA